MVRVKKDYKIITFATTTAAMAMEAYCEAKGLPGRLIPVPQEISSGCGVAWRIVAKDFPKLESSMQDSNIIVENIVDITM